MEKVEGHTLKRFLRERYDAGRGRYEEAAVALVVSREPRVDMMVCAPARSKAILTALRPIPPPIARPQRQLGEAIARIHDAEVVHGDLTTSNFLVVESGLGKWQLVRACA